MTHICCRYLGFVLWKEWQKALVVWERDSLAEGERSGNRAQGVDHWPFSATCGLVAK